MLLSFHWKLTLNLLKLTLQIISRAIIWLMIQWGQNQARSKEKGLGKIYWYTEVELLFVIWSCKVNSWGVREWSETTWEPLTGLIGGWWGAWVYKRAQNACFAREGRRNSISRKVHFLGECWSDQTTCGKKKKDTKIIGRK